MRKKALLALMMAAILLLSGCALIKKDQAVDDATEIIRMGDQVITKKEVLAQAEQELYDQYSMYSMFGYSYDVSDPENIEAAKNSAVDTLKTSLALTAKAKELGLDQLSDEELESVKTTAQANLDSVIASAKAYVEGGSEMDETALAEAAAKMAEDAGYTLDAYIAQGTTDAISAKLKEYAVKDVAVTDEEIQAEYDSRVESHKSTYSESAGTWASAANNNSTLYYTPAGVRRVKQILIKFKDEDKTAIDDAKTKLNDANTAVTTAQAKVDAAQGTVDTEGISDEDKAKAEETLSAAKQELEDADKALLAANQAVTEATDKAFANIDEKADAVLAQLAEEGADWQKIMDENNEDEGMKDNEKGYAVATGMTNFDAAFVDAAMALEKIGDISPKTKGSYGYYIIRYESDEAEGPVALDAVKETLSSSLLTTKQNDAYEATKAQWVDEAGIKVDLNALKD
ncbi:peptidylprolyl isomerase [Aristaeella hokkaidonensis]|uniref:Peptidylprolyl isomerase n=1 Tax=Aristaeella hokkaidonensis TaxID=3046382 RepID=A0AC61MVD4_9FIRM|nr:peptidylprolyl isomerase [Aristaeella hokkaidonensis]QUC66247.1 peptidylprolyl isomerase [Aristaeella hokkaidonensis]SNT95412.1 PPIC-type PPIASE domain-containing protein [Aristaeella hokkaidonensis]